VLSKMKSSMMILTTVLIWGESTHIMLTRIKENMNKNAWYVPITTALDCKNVMQLNQRCQLELRGKH